MLRIILRYIGFICLLFNMLTTLEANFSVCDEINYQALPKYNLYQKHARSTETIIIQKKLLSLRECKNFAILKKALAFNFNPTPNLSRREHDDYSFNCQVLNCPEIYSSTSLIRDQRYHYYSLYSRKLLPAKNNVNYIVTCVPKVGLFIFSKVRKNFTEAQQTCKNMHGTLAHIVSEERTQGLAKFINSPTFIGLNNRGKEQIWKNEFGEPLSCFRYRAWAKGEPTQSRGCTTLVKEITNKHDSRSFWKVASCSRRLTFVCEILPLKSKTHKKHRW
ncbi:uncharacterized protein [Chelonus insularis]|uniref:uncharacterized protein n=1 Tax=Chelonus insularis TaxID=460826 RepID=UPI00158E64EE|nr:uncharacterized protein LOC118073543 [Chelonus insularis]